MEERALKLEKRISFVADDELAPIPENTAFSKESTIFAKDEDIEEAAIQPHVAALYEYFGRTVAEDFLHPRMDAGGGGGGGAGASARGASDHTMRRERTNASLISNTSDVESLWSTLRADSQARLGRRDARMNERLKRAYNAFARQCLARHEAPPERSFAPRDDLDELTRLMSTSQVAAVKEHRRKKEVMYRQALVHEDQYRILEHNNPLPDLTNRSGKDGIANYIPTWNLDANSEDEEQPEEDGSVVIPVVPPPRHKRSTKPSLGEIAFDNMVLQSSRRPPSYTTKRYRFLDDRQYRATFRERIKEQFAAQNDPIESMLRQAQGRKDQDERNRRSATLDGAVLGSGSSRVLPGFALRRRSAHLGTGGAAAAATAAEEAVEVSRLAQRHGQSAPSSARALPWEPLSLGALLDYKKSRAPPLPSDRPFRAGQPSWWTIEEAQV